MQFLLHNGTDPEYLDDDRERLLSAASQNNGEEIFNLLTKGARLDSKALNLPHSQLL